MKSMRVLIIPFLIYSLLSCTYKKVNEQKTNIKDTVSSLVMEKEIFLDFVKAFHNDSTFMRARIKDRINGFNSDDYVIEDTLKNEYVWSEEDILFYIKDINEAYHNSKYKKEYKTLQNGNIEEYIYIPNSSCFYKCIFRFSEKKWYWCELIVNTL